MTVSKIIASCFGIGYIQKGAGTVAALFCCVGWYLLKQTEINWLLEGFILAVVFFVGVVTASTVEKEWGHDSNRVVIDEVQGMMVSVFLIPTNWQYLLAGFILFRFFDIAKPLGVRKMERFPSGWGVMMDDLLAGVYSNVILQVIVKSHLFS